MIREREQNREFLFNIGSLASVNIENFNESPQLPSAANQAEFNGWKKYRNFSPEIKREIILRASTYSNLSAFAANEGVGESNIHCW